MIKQVDSTIELLKGKLEEAAAKKAPAIIGKWEAEMEKAEWRGAKTIHEDLGKLRHHLEGDAHDKSAISELLVKLGHSTTHAAAHADGDDRKKLETLGGALVKAGQQLEGKA